MNSRSHLVVFRRISPWRSALAVSLSLVLSTSCATTFVPTDAKATCTDLTSGGAPFASWFESGSVTLNGVVKPPDSLNFPDVPNCSFYQWSEQMYLWVTSPAPARYGGVGRIFGSPGFFDVTPLDAQGVRKLIPHGTGLLPSLTARISPPSLTARFSPLGALGFPLVTAKDGRLLNVEPTPTGPAGRPLIQNARGEAVEIGRISMSEQHKPLFFDTAGQVIDGAHPLSGAQERTDVSVPKEKIIQKFMANNIPIFVDFLGNVVPVEQGQALTNAVLQAQNGSLVYYSIVVNQVYAYFLTGAKNGGISPTPLHFPTTAVDLVPVLDFAFINGKDLIDPQALAVEVKMAWVEAAGLPNPNSYIKTTASIPVYNTTNPLHWVKTGEKIVEVALVGMHVVGSAAGHPEMIWATFEHQSNMPNASYTYFNTSNVLKTVPQNTNGIWLFSSSGSNGPFNQKRMSWNQGDIDANTAGGFTIGPSDTIRWKSWGSAANKNPNPLVSVAASNTEIISINNTVRSLLPNGDVRKNYIMTGSTWTINGNAPTGSFDGTTATNEVGTSKLANGTLETYVQGTDSLFSNGSNCFMCHSSNTTSVSAIYNSTKQLF